MSTATTPAPQDFLTYEEAADYLGITVSALRQAISGEKLRPHKFPHNSRKYLTRQQLDDYRAGKHRHAAAPGPFPAGVTRGASSAPMASADELGARIQAASGPTRDALHDGLEKLTAIAVAVVLGEMPVQNGQPLDPKHWAGMLTRS